MGDRAVQWRTAVSWRTDLKHFDPDTLLILEIAERFLQDYFGHDAVAAERILSEYFVIKQSWIDESYVRHEHSWRIATEAQFRVEVRGAPGELFEWRRSASVVDTPREALEYLKRHYWDRVE
jgi:hypothetical protein